MNSPTKQIKESWNRTNSTLVDALKDFYFLGKDKIQNIIRLQ